jgi:hypothetical protein
MRAMMRFVLSECLTQKARDDAPFFFFLGEAGMAVGGARPVSPRGHGHCPGGALAKLQLKRRLKILCGHHMPFVVCAVSSAIPS